MYCDYVAVLQNLHYGNLPPAVVFPYDYFGNPKTKLEKFIKVQTPLEARKRAVASLPDNIIKLNKDSVQDFLIESYVGHPSKFPLVFFTCKYKLSFYTFTYK